MRRIDEHRRAHLVIAGVALGALLLTSAALAIQALAAARSARASISRSMLHLASIAAWEMARHLEADLTSAGRMATSPAARLNGRLTSEVAPSADELFAPPATGCDCARLDVVGYFESRPQWNSPKLAGAGWVPGDTSSVQALVQRFRTRRPAMDRAAGMDLHEGLIAHVLEDRDSRSRLLFTQPVHTRDGQLVALYGALVSSASADSFFAATVAGASLLPETITEAIPRDSLLRISVLGQYGVPFFRTKAAAAPTAYAARNPVGDVTPGVMVEAHLLAPATSIAAPFLQGRANSPVLLFVVTTLLVIGIGWIFMRGANLDRMRTEFMAGVAHEFHTPLALISAYAETSANGRANDERERRRFMSLIVRESQRLSHLVDNVQRVAAVGSHSNPPAFRVLSLTETTREACTDFMLLAAARGVEVLCESRDDIHVSGDVAAIRNALFNVLDNAVRYGGTGRTIRVFVDATRTRAEVIVDDEGPGIDPSNRERVFERFVRLTSALGPEASAGSGIGLSIVRDIMTAHGGLVVIERAPSGGTRVRLTWPLASAAVAGA